MSGPRGRYSPVDPVAYGAPVAGPGRPGHQVLSAVSSGGNAALVAEAVALWTTAGDVVADVTYGNGSFWKNLPGLRVLGTDLVLGPGAVALADCRALPYASRSLDVVAFDPPYQPMHGSPSHHFGVGDSYRSGTTGLQTITDVLGLYEAGLAEVSRVLRPGGRALVKCQDFVYNHRLHLVSLDVLRLMTRAEIDLADQFVLVNSSRMPKHIQRQQHARRAHSVLWVGVKAFPVPRKAGDVK